MARRLSIFILCASCILGAAAPQPEEHLGFKPGDDYKLANYGEIIGYFQKLERASGRIRLVEFGRTSEDRPMYVAFISSEDNLKRLDRYREISAKLALGKAEPGEAKRLAEEGKAVVWIDSGLHATEVAPAQHAPVLAYRLVSEESQEIEKIRRNVILLQVPCINPDGLDWMVEWYRKNVGTPYELAPMPKLYQKYAGHDNNRDWFMLNLAETRHVTRLLFQEWFPQIVYNQHQRPAFPARIFVPPYAEPLNPNVPASIMEGINLIGSAMKERFARENKPGVLSYNQFDAWWNGGLRTVPAFHNMHGILTETAGFGYATPRVYEASEIPTRFAGGVMARQPSIFYQSPWLGGTWTLREAIDYMLTADLAILNLAAERSSHFLYKAHELARASIETGRKGRPYAYVVSPEQWDRSSALEMLGRLSVAGVEVRRARSKFSAGGQTYPPGTYVLLAAQPFRPYLVDLLEPQKYPDIRTASGAPKRPYDIAGWTLPYQMGVSVNRIDESFQADLELLTGIEPPEPSLDHRENSSFLATADLLANGANVRWAAGGKILMEGRSPRDEFDRAAFELRRPRVALYEPWTANSDQGWTQWLLHSYRVPYTLVHNADVQKGRLRARFDTILLANQSASSILNGYHAPVPATTLEKDAPASLKERTLQRPEYTGGIGTRGLYELDSFVREGGTLIAIGSATELPVEMFPLGVRNRTAAPSDDSDEGGRSTSFYCPGSVLRITVDPENPIAFGMPKEAMAFSTGGQAFEITLLPETNKGDHEIRSVARYAERNLLASGWVSGERAVLGKHILLDARHGKGRVVLFGFRVQFRGQSFGTFKLLLNAIYLGSAKELRGS